MPDSSNSRRVAKEIEVGLNNKFHGLNTYVSTNFINITNSKVSKGKSLEYLLNYYNLLDNKIYTICKDDNDISLSNYESYVVNSNSDKFKHRVNSFEEAMKEITSE